MDDFLRTQKASDFRNRNPQKSSDKDQDIDLDVPNQPAGNLATQRLLRGGALEPKLALSQPNDESEYEADRAAEEIVRMPDTAIQNASANPQNQPEADHEDHAMSDFAPASLVQSLSSGRPLDPQTRAFFESRMGADFGAVRVHTDSQALASAQAVEAQAYTLGTDIVFDSDRYNPTTREGKRLLSHELVHVIQQNQNSAGKSSFASGAAGMIQRQPAPSPESMSTDPMTFIQDQLRQRFSDPDDPRLILRVQRLQEAFGRLTISESRGLLDRLREPSDDLAKNFQRLATPSRNRLRALLLRGLPAEIEDQVLGWVSSADAPMTPIPLIATIEVTPSTEEAGLFDGYGDLASARAAAVRRATVTAIVLDKKLGRHRVFETGLPTIRGVPQLRVAASESGLDYQLIDWVNLEGEELSSQQDRSERIVQAKKMLDDFTKTYGSLFALPGATGSKTADPQKDAARTDVENAYMALFEEAVPFAQGQFHFSFEFDTAVSQGQSKRMTTADPARVNIDVTDIYAHGRQKVLDPMDDLDYPGSRRRVSIKNALGESSPLPYEPYFALSPGALADEPLETRRVFLHEEAHRAHAQRTIGLIEDWKTNGSMTPFKDWLDNEVKNRRVSLVDAILAEEGVDQKGWAFNTELLAEVEGFIAVYHAIALGHDWALERLTQMADMWLNSDPAVQELGLRKLHHFYSQILDQAHREAFDQYVSKRWAEASQASNPGFKARESFYLKLAEFYEIH